MDDMSHSSIKKTRQSLSVYSTTTVPVGIFRIDPRRSDSAIISARIFRNFRDAALYLRIIYKTEDISVQHVSRCAEGCKRGTVNGTYHIARIADQLMCSQHGPVCGIQKVELLDGSEQMNTFFPNQKKEKPGNEFSTWREPRPHSALSVSSDGSPEALADHTARFEGRHVHGLRVPEMPSPFLKPPASGESRNTVKHIDGNIYTIVPLMDYRAPAPEKRSLHWTRKQDVDVFTRCFSRQVFSSEEGEGTVSESSFVPIEHPETTNWMGDRDRTSSSDYASEAVSKMSAYRTRLRKAIRGSEGLAVLGPIPSDPVIARMSKTVPAVCILSAKKDLYDNYIAVVLACLSINSRWAVEKIVPMVVSATDEALGGSSQSVLDMRAAHIVSILSKFTSTHAFLKDNRSTPDIKDVTSEALVESANDELRGQCCFFFRQCGLYDRLREHLRVLRSVPDLSIEDPTDGRLLSLDLQIRLECDRVLRDARKASANPKNSTVCAVVAESVWRKFGYSRMVGPSEIHVPSGSNKFVWKK